MKSSFFMKARRLWLLIALLLTSVALLPCASALRDGQPPNLDRAVKSATFRSPAFTLAPGQAHNAYYFNSSFVKGHIGIKSFYAEVVDAHGHPMPLSQVYLHHWVTYNYIYDDSGSPVILGNGGPCPDKELSQLFGLGSETRHTNTRIPAPYAIEVGKHDGEAWLLNVHAIDTRGTVDPFGCIECRCDLYNVTIGDNGKPLPEGYDGGLLCCGDGTRCSMKAGYVGENHTYFLQYTVRYMAWDQSIKPVNVYIFDATFNGSQCKVEYDVPSCAIKSSHTSKTQCVHTKDATMKMPISGEVIYGVAHQHAGGVGASIYGQDGREICFSTPIYGNGTEAGNEAGYIVGMTTCYPKPGSVRVREGESIRLLSSYSEARRHTGVMGLGYILVHPHSKALPMT